MENPINKRKNKKHTGPGIPETLYTKEGLVVNTSGTGSGDEDIPDIDEGNLGAIKGFGRRKHVENIERTQGIPAGTKLYLKEQKQRKSMKNLSAAQQRMKDMVDPLTGITSAKVGPLNKEGYPKQMHTPDHEPTERDKMHASDFGKAAMKEAAEGASQAIMTGALTGGMGHKSSSPPDAGDTQGFEERKPMTESEYYSDLEKSAPTLSPREQRQHDRKKKRRFRQQGRQATKSMNELMNNPIMHITDEKHKHIKKPTPTSAKVDYAKKAAEARAKHMKTITGR